MLANPRTIPVSVVVVLGCVGAMLMLTACGLIPSARPSPQPDTFILREDSASGHVLGHGSLRMTNSLRAKAEVTLYQEPGQMVSVVNLEGFLILTLPRHLAMHGNSGKVAVSLSVESPGPFSGDGESNLLPFMGRLRFDDPPVTRQTQVRAELYTEDHFLLQLPVVDINSKKTSVSLNITLWLGDMPNIRHIAAELNAQPLCHDSARSDENVSIALDRPFELNLTTAQGAQRM